MVPRSFWKGYLKLSPVTCPVQLAPATSDREKVKVHTPDRGIPPLVSIARSVALFCWRPWQRLWPQLTRMEGAS